MLKFFAKYNKIILVVGGSLLMVVFLLPAGGQILMPDPTNQVIGTVGGRTLTMGDRQTADVELDVLSRLLPGMAQSLPGDATTWLLIQHEARAHGIYASEAQGRAMIRQMEDGGIPVNRLLSNSGISESFLIQALRHFQMYIQLSDMVMGGGRPSDPRLRHFARDIQSRAAVDAACVDAAFLVEEIDEPDEQTLQAHFEEYKDDPPGTSEPYGFGYHLPPRVKVEYLAVPLERVAATVEVDEVDAHRYYIEHPERFTPARIDPSPESSGDGQQGGEEEAGAEQDPNEPLPYRQVRDQVRQELAEREAEAKQERMVRWLSATLNERIRRLPTDAQGYREFGEGYQPLGLDELAEQAEDEFGVRPEVVRIEDRWLTLEDVSEVEGLGDADLMGADQPVSAADYIASVRELDMQAPPALASLRLQEGVASRPVSDGAGNVYIFRVTDAQPAHEPESLDEVRDQVVGDVKRLRAYEQLQQRSDELLERAKEDGLEALAEAYDTEIEDIAPFSGRDLQAMFLEGRLAAPILPMIGRSEAFVDAVFATAQDVQEAGGLDDAAPEQAMGVVPVDNQQRVCVFQVTEYQPVDRGVFEQIKPQLPRMISQSDMRQIGEVNPMSREAVAERIGFVEAEGRDGQTGGGDAQENQPVSPAPLLR